MLTTGFQCEGHLCCTYILCKSMCLIFFFLLPSISEIYQKDTISYAFMRYELWRQGLNALCACDYCGEKIKAMFAKGQEKRIRFIASCFS